MKINIVTFEQPIGTFALGKMNAKDIIKIMSTNPRKYDPNTFEEKGHVQRELSKKRVKEIAKYATDDPNACFPTAIILCLPPTIQNSETTLWKLENDNTLYLNDNENDFALIVDGQHRMFGLKEAGYETFKNFEIPVVFLFEATLEQQALIFSIINEKQTKVTFSLVSQLFGVLNTRCKEKVAHTLASALNTRADSPFYKRVKMLGKKDVGIENQSISQGTIVREFLSLLKDGKVLHEFYEKNNEDFALKIILNYFNAAKNTWPTEWDNPSDFILTKTVGFLGLMKAFPIIFNEIDNSDKVFKINKFELLFTKAKQLLSQENNELTSAFFPSNSAGASKLSKLIIRAYQSN